MTHQFILFKTNKYSFLNQKNFEILNETDELIIVKEYGYLYSLYSKKNNEYLCELESKDLSVIKKEFEKRLDSTAQLSLEDKITLINDEELKEWISEKVLILKNSLKNFDKFTSIQASVKLSILEKLTLNELQEIAKKEKYII